ncbi:hypothetical protein Tco_0633963 [Tanacetum coccineum]
MVDPVDLAPLSMPVTGSLVPTRADLSPPHKRFRDSYSSEASIEEDAEGIDPMTALLVEEEIVEPAGEDSPDSPGTRDGIVWLVEDTPVDLSGAVCVTFPSHVEDRAWMAEIDLQLWLEKISRFRAMLYIERDRCDTGNGNNRGDNGNGNENHNVNGRGDKLVAHECTYQDFMKCQPLSFKGTEGVVGLIRWSEKMETVFHISNCPERYQVKYATCTLLDHALTWWNCHKRTIRTDAAYALS